MSQTIRQMTFQQLQQRLHETNDNMVVMNFWATWCKPCVEELPGFEKLNAAYSSKKVKVILVNLDFNSKIKPVAEPFVKKKKLKAEIWHITDTDPNTWINKIDSTWSGAIPATIVYDKSHNKIKFHEGQMTYEQLEEIVLPSLENQELRTKSQEPRTKN